MPPVFLSATDGSRVNLAERAGRSVIYIYPRTSPPNGPAIEGWDAIPGAKGCTPQSCAFRDHHAELLAAGAGAVFGLSVQDSAYQAELRERLHLPFHILSDEALQLQAALDLPTFEAAGVRLLTRMTLIVKDGVIEKVFFPVENPPQNAEEVLAYLRSV